MKKLLIANWKMNPVFEKDAVKLAQGSDIKNTVIAPPFLFLKSIKSVLKNATLCAQDVFYEEQGAYTGEVSPLMLKKLGVKYVLVGHSERRHLGESDGMILKKMRTTLDAGLKVVLCVGEPLSVRKKGDIEVKKYIKNQLRGVSYSKSLIVAYEPIWAIGTGRYANPEDALSVVQYIKSIISVPVLYGGSTNSQNAKGFLEKKEIDGLLIGRTSLNAKEFEKIAKIAEEI